jgi:hypothetical protein
LVVAQARAWESGSQTATSEARGVFSRKWRAWRAPMRPRPETETWRVRTIVLLL